MQVSYAPKAEVPDRLTVGISKDGEFVSPPNWVLNSRIPYSSTRSRLRPMHEGSPNGCLGNSQFAGKPFGGTLSCFNQSKKVRKPCFDL